MEKYFTIKNHNDVFDAVGQIIKASQEWEMQYKDYALRQKIDVENLDYATLNRLNYAMREQGKITDKEFFDLKRIIRLRNYINHEFFIEDFNKEIEYLDQKINQIMFLILELAKISQKVY